MIEIKTCIEILDITAGGSYQTLKIIDDLNSSINDLVSKLMPQRSYTPTPGDRIYFIPGCEVPRFKVKQLCEKYDVALVKYREKANVKFVGAESFKKCLSGMPYYTYHKQDFINYLITAVGNNSDYINLITALKESTSIYVTMEYPVMNEFEKGVLGPKFKKDSLSNNKHPNFYFKDEESYELFMSVNNDEQVYNQNEILSRINTGGVMGPEQYESIKRMLVSADQENLKLAMEAMANSDYEKSCVSLLLLMKEYGSKMEESRTKSHVNFKSLLKFFEVQNLSNLSLDGIIKSLLKRKLLNKTNLDQLMPMAISEMKEKAKTKYFKIADVSLSSEIVSGLEDNVLDKNPNTEIVEDPKEQLNPRLSLNLNL